MVIDPIYLYAIPAFYLSVVITGFEPGVHHVLHVRESISQNAQYIGTVVVDTLHEFLAFSGQVIALEEFLVQVV